MARYGMDYNTNRSSWNRGMLGRNYDTDFDRGYSGREGWSDREGLSGMRSGLRGSNRGYDYGMTGGYAGGGGSYMGTRGGYEVGYRSGGFGRKGSFDRSGDYDRDFGDRLREGWQDIKQSARGMFNRGYDRGW